jgi:hypothetical protein
LETRPFHTKGSSLAINEVPDPNDSNLENDIKIENLSNDNILNQSSLLGAINFITTILIMRSPGIRLYKLAFFG